MSFPWFAFYTLWLAPALLMALLVAVMRHRHLHRELPAFYAYAILTALRTPVLFFLFHRYPLAYSYLYWAAEAGSAILGFAAIYEVFRHLFPGQERARRLGDLFFRWTAAVFVLLGVVVAAASPENTAGRLAAAVLVLTQGVRLVQCGLVMFLFAFSYFSGLVWRRHALGVALGFGLFAGVQLVAIAVQARAGMVNSTTWTWVNLASYNCAVLVWMRYLLAPEKAGAAASAPVATEVKSWNQALLQLLQR